LHGILNPFKGRICKWQRAVPEGC